MWRQCLRTFARHSDFIAFLESTELAAVATERRDVTVLVARTTVRHALCNAATKETLQTSYSQHYMSASAAIPGLCLHPLLYHAVTWHQSMSRAQVCVWWHICLRCYSITSKRSCWIIIYCFRVTRTQLFQNSQLVKLRRVSDSQQHCNEPLDRLD